MRSIFHLATILLMTLAMPCMAQTSRPAMSMQLPPGIDRAALDVRATQEFGRGQYAVALPMLKKLEEMTKGQPDLLGPIQEKIRVCERNLADPNSTANAAPASLNTNRKPHPAPTDGETLDMPIKDLGNFDYDADKGGEIPRDVVALSGHKIRLKGYMIPMDQAANITQFALVPDLFACCFGQPPQIQHTIVANCPKGKAVSYYPDQIIVEGNLKVAEKKDEGFIVSIFEMDVSSVKPAPQ
jgi:hypothetical protein